MQTSSTSTQSNRTPFTVTTSSRTGPKKKKSRSEVFVLNTNLRVSLRLLLKLWAFLPPSTGVTQPTTPATPSRTKDSVARAGPSQQPPQWRVLTRFSMARFRSIPSKTLSLAAAVAVVEAGTLLPGCTQRHIPLSLRPTIPTLPAAQSKLARACMSLRKELAKPRAMLNAALLSLK